MNERRGFFKALLGAGSAVAISSAAVPPPVNASPDINDFTHLGNWRICWSGWQRQSSSNLIVGNWTATPAGWDGIRNAHGVYSSIPGSVYPFHKGDMFDVSVNPGQEWMNAQMSEQFKDIQSLAALKRLLKFIDNDPRADWKKCSFCNPAVKRVNDPRYPWIGARREEKQ